MTDKLPPKEAATFKKIVKFYEAKQLKPALKHCRQILGNPKFADHGETLAMKGLILNNMGRREEGEEFVKQGLKRDLKSAVCWHVYGLVHKNNRRYDEAIKCYRNAIKWDKENVQIFRDLSMVQLHLKEIEGFRDARFNLLKLRPSQQSSWVGYALAYYLLQDYPMALKVISEYRKTMMVSKVPQDYSEVVLFEVLIMVEAGNLKDALKHLSDFEPHIGDGLSMSETRGSIYMDIGRLSDAEQVYRQLVHRNPENYFYHRKLEECLRLESEEARLAHYQELSAEFPHSHVIRRMPLLIARGDVFRDLIDRFLRNSLRKGVPSIFVSIKVHYKDPEKVRIMEELISGYVSSLRKCGKLNEDSPSPPELQSTHLWTLVLLAQHFDHVRNCHRALELINEAIKHTPTEMQLYMIKARIYKHGGDLLEAAKWMEEARLLDTADRFVNCKCVKYLFRINRIEYAIDVAGLFTREGNPTMETMDDMQCNWFQLEIAHAYRRLGKLGEALQKVHEIDKHFADVIEDQFDFHGYTMRRVTLRSYLGILKSEDKLRQHPFFFEASKMAIEIYVFLHDHPEAKKGTMNGPLTVTSEATSSELKKRQRKERKAQLKAKAKAQEEKKENKPHKPSEHERPSSDDYKVKFVAKDLLEAENPLEESLKFLRPLQSLSGNRLATNLLAYTVHSRRRKFLLMLQSLKRAKAADPEDGELHSYVVDFILAFDAAKSDLPNAVREVVEESRPSLTDSKSLVDLNQDFLDRHRNSLDHMIPASKVLYRLRPDNRSAAIDYVTNLSDGVEGRSLKNCSEVLRLLGSDTFGPPDTAARLAYEDKCSKLFPLASVFRRGAPPGSGAAPPGGIAEVKDSPPKNISANTHGGGVVVLKATSLSSTAMSDLSGDINDETRQTGQVAAGGGGGADSFSLQDVD